MVFEANSSSKENRNYNGSLLLEHLFNLADLLLNFAGELLVLAFSRQVWAVRGLSNLLFGFALHFVKLAFDLVLAARFHLFSLSSFFRKTF